MSERRLPLSDSYEGLYQRALLAQNTGDFEGAVELYRRLVERLGRLSDQLLGRRPELRDLLFHGTVELSELLQEQGRYAEAIEVKETLLKTNPEQANHWRRDLAVLRVAKGETETGFAELRALAEQEPPELWNWAVLGDEARIEGRFAEGEAAFDRALQLAKQQKDTKAQAQIQYARFRLFEAMGRPDDAMAAWEDAASSDADVRRSIREVYKMLTDAGRYTEAQRYIARDNNPLQAGFQRGLLASLTGDTAKAKEEWEAVAALDPTQYEYGQDCWAEAALRLGDADSVVERLPALARKPGSARLLLLSGIAWAVKADAPRAQKAFEQVIGVLRRSRPPKQKLDSADWRLLDSLVKDDETKAKLRPYFAVIETIWG